MCVSTVNGQINLTQGMCAFNGAERSSPFWIRLSGSMKMEVCLLRQVNREEAQSCLIYQTAHRAITATSTHICNTEAKGVY